MESTTAAAPTVETSSIGDRLKRLLRGFQRHAKTDAKGAVTLRPRQIYIFPTRHGFLFAAVLLLMFFGSLNYANNPGFLFTFLLVGLGLVAIIHTWRNLVGLELREGKSNPVFAGQDACYNLTLSNHRTRTRPGIRLDSGSAAGVIVDLPASGSNQVRICIPDAKRGDRPLGRVVVSTTFPLGLLKAWCYLDINLTCLVYPRPADRKSPPPSPFYSSSEQGDRGVGADDFVGLRPYRPGDPPRHLDWKAMARERGIVTKQFGGDRAEKLWLDWDDLAGIDAEFRLSLLCRWVLSASEEGQSYGLRLPGLTQDPGRSKEHKLRCLAALARYDPPE